MQECSSAKIEPKNSGFTYIVQGLKAFIQDVYLVYTSFLGSLPFKVVWGRSHSITTMDWRCKGDPAVSKYRQRAAGRRKNRVLCMTSVIFTTLRPRVDFISVYFSALVGCLGFTIKVEMSFLQNSARIGTFTICGMCPRLPVFTHRPPVSPTDERMSSKK